MADQCWRAVESQGRQLPVGYEPPRVERVLTLGDLEREVLYAGPVDGSTQSTDS